jgi:hypothetical protein
MVIKNYDYKNTKEKTSELGFCEIFEI